MFGEWPTRITFRPELHLWAASTLAPVKVVPLVLQLGDILEISSGSKCQWLPYFQHVRIDYFFAGNFLGAPLIRCWKRRLSIGLNILLPMLFHVGHRLPDTVSPHRKLRWCSARNPCPGWASKHSQWFCFVISRGTGRIEPWNGGSKPGSPTSQQSDCWDVLPTFQDGWYWPPNEPPTDWWPSAKWWAWKEMHSMAIV